MTRELDEKIHCRVRTGTNNVMHLIREPLRETVQENGCAASEEYLRKNPTLNKYLRCLQWFQEMHFD